jgi:hypothetical protein
MCWLRYCPVLSGIVDEPAQDDFRNERPAGRFWCCRAPGRTPPCRLLAGYGAWRCAARRAVNSCTRQPVLAAGQGCLNSVECAVDRCRATGRLDRRRSTRRGGHRPIPVWMRFRQHPVHVVEPGSGKRRHIQTRHKQIANCHNSGSNPHAPHSFPRLSHVAGLVFCPNDASTASVEVVKRRSVRPGRHIPGRCRARYPAGRTAVCRHSTDRGDHRRTPCYT